MHEHLKVSHVLNRVPYSGANIAVFNNVPSLIMEQRRMMLEAKLSFSDSSPDKDSPSGITSSDSDSESDSSDGSRDHHSHCRSSTPPHHYCRDSLPHCGRDDSRSPSPPRHPHRDSPPTAGQMTAAHHCHHLALAGMVIDMAAHARYHQCCDSVLGSPPYVTSMSAHRRHVEQSRVGPGP
jgi:hypothetical protein